MRRKDTLLAIGEALIDFIPGETGKRIMDVSSFCPAVGGAPANVCGAFVKLGGKARMITQLGNDPFGDKIEEEFRRCGIDCRAVSRTDEANTSLSFVALREDGDREFAFFRKPGADMLLKPEQICPEWFSDGYALHFCSVSLGNYPMKEAHRRAIACAKQEGMPVSFDPNLRRALWNDDRALREAVNEFMEDADIVKVSDEELEFITGESQPEKAVRQLLGGSVKLVICTEGPDGARAYTGDASARVPGIRVRALDTTGAGDAFIGSFLHGLYEAEIGRDELENISSRQLEELLSFSNRYCAASVQKKGAIASYPAKGEVI